MSDLTLGRQAREGSRHKLHPAALFRRALFRLLGAFHGLLAAAVAAVASAMRGKHGAS